jgi:hypothetical protein
VEDKERTEYLLQDFLITDPLYHNTIYGSVKLRHNLLPFKALFDKPLGEISYQGEFFGRFGMDPYYFSYLHEKDSEFAFHVLSYVISTQMGKVDNFEWFQDVLEVFGNFKVFSLLVDAHELVPEFYEHFKSKWDTSEVYQEKLINKEIEDDGELFIRCMLGHYGLKDLLPRATWICTDRFGIFNSDNLAENITTLARFVEGRQDRMGHLLLFNCQMAHAKVPFQTGLDYLANTDIAILPPYFVKSVVTLIAEECPGWRAQLKEIPTTHLPQAELGAIERRKKWIEAGRLMCGNELCYQTEFNSARTLLWINERVQLSSTNPRCQSKVPGMGNVILGSDLRIAATEELLLKDPPFTLHEVMTIVGSFAYLLHGGRKLDFSKLFSPVGSNPSWDTLYERLIKGCSRTIEINLVEINQYLTVDELRQFIDSSWRPL